MSDSHGIVRSRMWPERIESSPDSTEVKVTFLLQVPDDNRNFNTVGRLVSTVPVGDQFTARPHEISKVVEAAYKAMQRPLDTWKNIAKDVGDRL